jgi:hypothetical protein
MYYRNIDILQDDIETIWKIMHLYTHQEKGTSANLSTQCRSIFQGAGDTDEYAAMVERFSGGKPKKIGEYVLVPVCPSRILHEVTRIGTRAPAVRCLRLTLELRHTRS